MTKLQLQKLFVFLNRAVMRDGGLRNDEELGDWLELRNTLIVEINQMEKQKELPKTQDSKSPEQA